MKINQEIYTDTCKVAKKIAKPSKKVAKVNPEKKLLQSRKLPNCIGAPDEVYNTIVIYNPDFKETLQQLPQWIKDIINK